jgi:flagellar hook protein FlgE
MLRSMFSGISGLRSHQTMMDVVGNNIANVNTTGYKAQRATFQESLTQVTRGATGANLGAVGGINPMQIGLGIRVGAIDGQFGQGAIQVTGRVTDLAITGEGWFVVQANGEEFLTRSGVFGFDELGQLVGANGEIVNVEVGEDYEAVLDAAAAADPEFNADEYEDFRVPPGIVGVTINPAGQIIGRNAAGEPQHIGTIQMRTVMNPGGLTRAGNGLYQGTPNAGVSDALLTAADIQGTAIESGTLEMSNVDLAQEFTNLILAQRGFQANSRTITTSDEMLQELVNLKR